MQNSVKKAASLMTGAALIAIVGVSGFRSIAQTSDFGPADGGELELLEALAGPDIAAASGDTVFLDGSRSVAADDGPLTYLWSINSSPVPVSLDNPSAIRPSFTLSTPGSYEFDLTVSGTSGQTSTDRIIVSTENIAPVADAGLDRIASVGDTVTFDGSGSSDANGNGISYEWSLFANPSSTAALVGADTVRPSLTLDIEGTYTLDLVVRDADGAASAVDQLTLTTLADESVSPIANAGASRSVTLGDVVTLDPDGTLDLDGDQLTAEWTIISAPSGADVALIEDTDGRFNFVPDIAGDYVVQLGVNDGTSLDHDTVLISAGTSLGVSPVADAGSNGVAVPGANFSLDGSASTDLDGDQLTYAWSLITRPDGSTATIATPDVPRTVFTPDLAGTYVAQLVVSDGVTPSSRSTVTITSDGLGPIANAGPDGLIVDGAASLDGSGSTGTGLSFAWSVPGLSAGAERGEFLEPNAVTTSITVPVPEVEGDGLLSGPDVELALQLLADNNLIVFGDLDAQSDVEERTLVGGNIVGNSSTYASRLNNVQGTDVLTVVGNISGGSKNINGGGTVRVGGSVNTNLNLNGGGQLVQDPSLSLTAEIAALRELSTEMSTLEANSDAQIPSPSGQPGPVRLNASPNEDGVAIFNIADGNLLLSNDRAQQIEMNLNGAQAVIINVGGSNIRFNRGNIVGALQQDSVSRRIIWNFYEATDLFFERGFEGSVLAPFAQLENRSNIDGSVAVAGMRLRARVGVSGFIGTGLVGEGGGSSDPVDDIAFALVQLEIEDGSGLPASYDTTVLTVGNVRPVAVASVPGSVSFNETIIFDASASVDLNGDALTYIWSIVSQPEDSTAVLSDPAALAPTLTADAPGTYIAQLVVREAFAGGLASRPVTVTATVDAPPPVNEPPVFTSAPVLVAQVGEPYTYTAVATDPESGTLVYSLDTSPIGLSIDTETGIVTFTPLNAGTETVTIKATDPAGAFATQSYEITVAPSVIPNAAPVLAAIGDQNAPLGQTLTIQLVATDTDGADLVTFMVTPLPLPDGATLESSTGLFTYQPGSAQAGQSFDLTFIASDGVLTDSETITISVGDAGDPGATAISGRLLDAVAFAENGTEIPVVGAVVQVLGSGTPVTTGSDGVFSVPGIASGRQLIDIVASGATPAPDGTNYTNFREGLEITEGVDNIIDRPFFLSRIAPDSVVTVDPTQVTVLDSTSTGIRIEIQPASAVDENGQLFSGELSIALVPTGLTPAQLPSNLQAGYVFSVQPAGLTFIEPAQITIPNIFQLEPGEQLQLFSLDPIVVESILEVTPNGQSMTSIQGGILTTAWKAPLPDESDESDDDGDDDGDGDGDGDGDDDDQPDDEEDKDPCNCDASPSGSSTEVASGALRVSHDTAGFLSLGQNTQYTFVYNSLTAAPRPVVSRSINTQVFRPDLQEFPVTLDIGGTQIGVEQIVGTSGLSPRSEIQNTFARSFDASSLPTGRYSYAIEIGSRLAGAIPGSNFATSRNRPYPGEVLINNSSQSEFGSGWGLANLTRLHVGEDEVIITAGTGAIAAFDEEPSSITYSSRPIAIAAEFEGIPISDDFGFGGSASPATPNAITDINNDDFPDIVSAQGDRLVIALQNESTGLFNIVRTVRPFATDTDLPIVNRFAFADFNEDGVEDLIIDNEQQRLPGEPLSVPATISLHEGQGGGFFEQVVTEVEPSCDPDFDVCRPVLVTDVNTRLTVPTTDGSGVLELIAIDVDNDAHTDIVAFTSLNAIIYFGDGTGSFAESVTVDIPNTIFFTRFYVTDFNGDGLIDLSAQTETNSDREATNLLNVNGRDFVSSTVSGGPNVLFAGRGEYLGPADFDGDGNVDLVFTGRRQQSTFLESAYIARGNGDGSFEPVFEIEEIGNLGTSRIAEVTGDGLPDLISFSIGAEGLSAFKNDAGENLTEIGQIEIAGFTDIATGDFNNDGLLDFVRLQEDRQSLDTSTQAEFAEAIIQIGPNGEFIFESGFQILANGDTISPEQLIPAGTDFRISINGDGNLVYIGGGEDPQTRIFAPNGDEILPDGTIVPGVVPIGPDGRWILDFVPGGKYVLPNGDAIIPEAFTSASDVGNSVLGDGSISVDSGFSIISPNGDQRFFDDSVRPFGITGSLISEIRPTNLYTLTEAARLLAEGSAAYRSPAGDFSELVRLADGSYRRTFRQNTVVTYDVNGNQTSSTDTNGNTTLFEYDSDNKLIQITDPVGLQTNFAYENGLLSTLTDPVGRTTRFEHDGPLLTSIVDPDGTERSFRYEANGLMAAQTSKRGFETRYFYDAINRHILSEWPDDTTRVIRSADSILANGDLPLNTIALPLLLSGDIASSFTNGRGATTLTRTDVFGGGTEIVDPIGRVTQNIRRGNGSISVSISPAGRRTRIARDRFNAPISILQDATTDFTGANINISRRAELEYDRSTGFLLSLTEANSAGATPITTRFDRDTAGNPIEVTDALNQSITSTFDNHGLTISQSDRNGNTTTNTYDSLGNRSQTLTAAGDIVQIIRDNVGNISQIIEGVGTSDERQTSLTYDELNRLVSITDGTGATTFFRYDSAGNLEETEDATGIVIRRKYDSRDRLIAIDDAASGRTEFVLDEDGNITQITDAVGAVINFSYDLANQLKSMVDASGQTTAFEYDLDGNLVSVTNARGARTEFTYDPFGRTATRSDPLGGTTTFSYDSRDNLLSTTDAIGQTVTNQYDKLNRLTRTDTPDNTLTFTYDPVGNLLGASDNDTALSYTYDQVNRLVDAVSSGAMSPDVTLTSSYNPLSLRTSLTDSFGGNQTYAYDRADRLETLTTNQNNTITLAYDAAGRPIGVTFPNTVVGSATYENGTGRLASLAFSSPSINLHTSQYGYNDVGNITSIDEAGQIGVRARRFNYDELQRLTSGGTDAEPETYSYDAVGNRETSHLSAIHATNDADRLQQDDRFTYEYDANGNLTTQTEIATGGVTNYLWDAQDQLIGVSNADGSAVAYAYDALGRRSAKTIGAITELYAYDGDDIYLEVDETNAVQARYAHGDRLDSPLAFERSGDEFYFHTDHQGSIRQVTDSTGAVVNQYNYDSYGQFIERVETVAQIYGYTAREQDAESPLYYYRSRYYDPRVGRFTQEDRIGFDGNDINIYRYVGNDPLNFTDPVGEQGVGVQEVADSVLFLQRRSTSTVRMTAPDIGNEIQNFVNDRTGQSELNVETDGTNLGGPLDFGTGTARRLFDSTIEGNDRFTECEQEALLDLADQLESAANLGDGFADLARRFAEFSRSGEISPFSTPRIDGENNVRNFEAPDQGRGPVVRARKGLLTP